MSNPLPLILSSPLPFIGGNIINKLRNWEALTSDSYILGYVKGVSLDFMSWPSQAHIPRPFRMNVEQSQFIDGEIESLKSRSIVEEVEDLSSHYVSNIFLRPKPNGTFRMMIDLSLLNNDIEKRHFKMQHLQVAIDLLSRNCFMASIDLKDAYYSVPIAVEFRKFLCFEWRGKFFRFKAMPFGLTSAPRISTKLLTPVFSAFREEGFQGFAYVDDSFILGDSAEECTGAVEWLSKKLTSLGFIIHPQKSIFQPSKSLVFLGYRLDSEAMTVSPTEEKLGKVSEKINSILGKDQIKIREVASLAGLLNDVSKAVDYGLCHNKGLEIDKIRALKSAGRLQYDGSMRLSNRTRMDLGWWLWNIPKGFRKIRATSPSLTLTTDASLSGWGAVWEGNSSGGRWGDHEKTLHINVLELRAVWLGLNTFCRQCHGVDIKVESDNTTTVTYLNNQGGTRSLECNEQARQIWNWCETRELWLWASHIPGVSNEEADFESRNFTENTEWGLNKKIFQRICDRWGTPDVDLFASRLNHQVPCYASWGPDPFCSFVNAFTFKWSEFDLCFIFPPFRLMTRCVQKIREEGANAVVVSPSWPGQPWWSVMLRRAKDRLSFPSREGNLFNTSGAGEEGSLGSIGLTAVLIWNK